MTDAFDTARAALLASVEVIDSQLTEARSKVARLMAERSVVEAELKGLDRGRELLAPTTRAPEPAKRTRNDVQGTVSALLASVTSHEDGWATEQWLMEEAERRSSIGPHAVHTYLLRAVKANEVERGTGDRYRLPQRSLSEFALLPPAQDAAQ